MHGIIDRVRKCRMPLDAIHQQSRTDRPAPANSHRIAKYLLAAGLADQAIIGLLSPQAGQFSYPLNAVNSQAFFVTGQQQACLAGVFRVGINEFAQRNDHRRHRALHVRRPASV